MHGLRLELAECQGKSVSSLHHLVKVHALGWPRSSSQCEAGGDPGTLEGSASQYTDGAVVQPGARLLTALLPDYQQTTSRLPTARAAGSRRPRSSRCD